MLLSKTDERKLVRPGPRHAVIFWGERGEAHWQPVRLCDAGVHALRAWHAALPSTLLLQQARQFVLLEAAQ